MDTLHDETMLERMAARLDELEQANTRLSEEVAALRAERRPALGQPTVRVHMSQPQGSEERNGRPSRRGMLRAVLGVAAATVGAGALVETQTGTALAQADNPGGPWTSSNGFTPADQAFGTGGSIGVKATSDSSAGVWAKSDSNAGVLAESKSGPGVSATSDSNAGVLATSGSNAGVLAQSKGGPGVIGSSAGDNSFGVFGSSSGSGGTGVFGSSSGSGGNGVIGRSSSNGYGVIGTSASGNGVIGSSSSNGDGVIGTSASGNGVTGRSSSNGDGVIGTSASGNGVHARSEGASAVALLVEGLIRVQPNAVGQTAVGNATLPADTRSFTVPTQAATASSIILLTPLSDPGVPLWISARAAGSFTISASEKVRASVTIQYLIIN